MKFLLDVCAASRTLHQALVDDGHDVLSARDSHGHASDEELLALAHGEDRVLVTEDKDFGELVSCAVCRTPASCGWSDLASRSRRMHSST